jgi:N-acetyl-gamma-glutamylphosphate reductase
MSQPLVEWRPGCGWAEPSFAFQGMTGYSAAGHKGRPGPMRMAQLGTPHRHLAEIAHFSDVEPMLTTAIGGWERGMMVQTTVKLPLAHALAACQAAYAGMPDIQVRLATEGPAIHAEMHNGTNQLTLALAEQPYGGTTLVAAYDNLGKGSAGAAADNLRRMLA